MENKKQLIIIPPMSEALKKLNEVLETISVDENVEISMIDDLRELSQFIATTGQCLILASNAKKCATFLQDNKVMLAKSHCKTILFTPKEIPAKTLVKFTKIGLTESILENSPPKTFLYKVKLLLRSIKTAKPQEDAEKLVKSLENGKAQGEEATDREIKEKLTAEENVIDMETGKKKKNDDSGETIDYGNPMKGKIKPQDESIDTNWKSDRKKHAGTESTEEENMAAESELSSIDMYYRGKRKKIDDLMEPVEDEFGKLKKYDIAETEDLPGKKSNYADVIDEGSMKQKRFDLDEVEATEEKKSSVELDLIAGSTKNKKRDIEDESLDLSMNRPRLAEPTDEAAKTRDVDIDDLGGYLKGKVSKQLGADLGPELKDETDYDNSEIEKAESPSDYDLDLLAANKKAKKKDNDEGLEDNVHEGEVDQIDGNMIGNEGTVDKIRTRMNGISDPSAMPKEEDETNLSFYGKKAKPAEGLDEEEEKSDSLDLEAGAEKERENLAQKEEDEELELRQTQTKLNLLPGDKEKTTDESTDPVEREHERQAQLEKLKEDKERKASASEEDDELDLRSRNSSGIKEQKDRNQTHDGQVDKIDTFYRGGESNKKSDHNWDNLTDKKTNLDILPGTGKTSGFSTEAAAGKDYSETTIDYRKLKEEFDMMSSGGSFTESGAFRKHSDTNLKNNDDEGSFKVVEIDPKSLDFSIAIVNSIYNKDLKAKQIFAMITDELLNNYHCYPVFYTYKLSDKKFTEVFNTYNEVKAPRMTDEKVNWWSEFKKDTLLFEHYQSKSMTTWRCPEIMNEGIVWEDVELPTWAEQELKTKQVELIFPYFDGLDRMGLAVVFFPDGLDPKAANGLLTVLEMARTLFLDTVQRYQVVPVKEKEVEVAPVAEEKKNVLSFFGGLFGKRKAG
jgi:hypothetical protein